MPARTLNDFFAGFFMVEGDREKEKEVSVRHEIVFPKWKTWDCINFTGDCNKNYFAAQSRGFGFVEMPAQPQAQTAIKSLNGKELLGKQMNVKEARPRADEGRTGGGRMVYGGRGNRY